MDYDELKKEMITNKDEIKILGLNYKLNYVDSISKEELRVGEIDYLNQEIRILKDMEQGIKDVTLIHEVLHAIFNQLGFEEEQDEHLIQSLATSLYQVFIENVL